MLLEIGRSEIGYGDRVNPADPERIRKPKKILSPIQIGPDHNPFRRVSGQARRLVRPSRAMALMAVISYVLLILLDLFSTAIYRARRRWRSDLMSRPAPCETTVFLACTRSRIRFSTSSFRRCLDEISIRTISLGSALLSIASNAA